MAKRLAYMRGLFYSILHSKVISGPLFKEVVYQCHASFCEIAYGVLVGGKPMCRWNITGADIYEEKDIFAINGGGCFYVCHCGMPEGRLYRPEGNELRFRCKKG